MKVKFCGMRRKEDIEFANKTKPDYIGFILSPGFRRSITLEQARELRQFLTVDIPVVGVFVDAPMEHMITAVEEGVIDMIQLHGEETEEDIVYLKAVTGVPIIKAVKAENRYSVEAWLDSDVDFLLFDSGTGTGKTFDWRILYGIERDFFLAGGLGPDNITEAIQNTTAYCMDTSSGIETDGVKDLDKMKEMIRKVRG